MSPIATLTVAIAAVLMFTAGPQASGSQATTTPPAGSQAAKPAGQGDYMTSGRDEDFLREVAQASQIEVESSKLAMTKAQNAEVKAFAEKLVKEHTAASEELNTLVKSRHAEWKDDDPKFREKKQKHESLQKLTGAEFDKEYLEDMISDHESTIALFARYSLNASDTALKSFADKTQPTLREHLKMARDLRAKIGK